MIRFTTSVRTVDLLQTSAVLFLRELRHGILTWIGPTSRVIVATKNSDLPEVNEIIRDMIPGPYRTFLSAEKVENEDQNALRYPVELWNTFTAR